VAYAEREREVVAPAAVDGVDVGSADTARINGNVNIGLLELLEGKLRSLLAADPILCHVDTTHVFARELAPLLDISDGKRVGGVRVTHCGCECVVVVWNWVSIARREKFCKVAIR